MKKKLLLEGPVGHMYHPFDLDKVQTGADLLSVFENEVVDYINQYTPSIKIDGINGPIRLITKEDGEKEFAIDRLSTSPLDRRGVTADRLRERFEKAILQALDTDEEIKIPLHKLVSMGLNIDDLVVGKVLTITHRKKNKKVVVKQITTGHGFVNDGGVALQLCNDALRGAPSEMQRVLEVLDMWDNPQVCLNNDIVHESSKESGMVNAVKYGEDFIAFHGLNEIYSPEGKSARKTREIRLTDEKKQALTDFVNLLNEYNTIDGFRALSPYDTVALKGEVSIDYSPALSTVVEIKLDPENAVAKSIAQWLGDPKIFKPEYGMKFDFPEVEGFKGGKRQYIFEDGRTRDFFSKDNYVALIPDEGEIQYSVRDLLSADAHPELTEDDFYRFASGAIFYHATRLLGRQVLITLINKSKVGNDELTSHEGVVMRSQAVFGIDDPVKITGDFIRSGMAGGIKKAMVKESTEMSDLPPDEIGDEEEERVEVNTQGTKTVAIMPGSFKPPHMGHLGMAEELAKRADEVLIFVSKPGVKSKRLLPLSNAEITYEKAIQLWKVLLKEGIGNIKIIESSTPSPSPVAVLDNFMKPKEEREYYKDVEFYPEDYEKFFVGVSEKDADDTRFDMYANNDKIEKVVVPAIDHTPQYAKVLAQLKSDPVHSEQLRMLDADVQEAALQFAKDHVSAARAKKLSANPTLDEIIPLLSKPNQKKVAKLLKTTPENLDIENYSATDLRLLLDLKARYDLPVDLLIKDFVGNNVEEYFRTVFGEAPLNESIDIIRNLVMSILNESEELDEMSMVSGGAMAGAVGGGSKPSKTEDEEDEEKDKPVDEALAPWNELPHQAGSASTITVKLIPHSRSKTDGGVSDDGYKRSVNNKFKIDGRLTNKRAPYYDEGDVIHALVEKVLRNIIRAD